jgi:hypothetical protein
MNFLILPPFRDGGKQNQANRSSKQMSTYSTMKTK